MFFCVGVKILFNNLLAFPTLARTCYPDSLIEIIIRVYAKDKTTSGDICTARPINQEEREDNEVLMGDNREAIHDSFINDNSDGYNDNTSKTHRSHTQEQIKRQNTYHAS